jgi:hypothetical protein
MLIEPAIVSAMTKDARVDYFAQIIAQLADNLNFTGMVVVLSVDEGATALTWPGCDEKCTNKAGCATGMYEGAIEVLADRIEAFESGESRVHTIITGKD